MATDIRDIMRSAGTQSPRATWLYTREWDSVWLDVFDAEQSLRLTVSGPNYRRAIYDFEDARSLLQYQMRLEASLLAQGYRLDRFRQDRRRGHDRRQRGHRGATDRRKP
jgi:hypothetical protein